MFKFQGVKLSTWVWKAPGLQTMDAELFPHQRVVLVKWGRDTCILHPVSLLLECTFKT